MNYDHVIAARARLMEVDAMWGIGVAIFLLVAAVVCWLRRKRASDGDPVCGWTILACCFAAIGAILLPVNLHDYFTADLQALARQPLPKHNVVEVK